jgi:membrane protein DedA with SNARE-associated domain
MSAALLGNGTLDHLLHTYGYAAVFSFVAVESLGIPLPGETMLIAASIYAGSTHRLSITGVVAFAAAGAIIGDNVGYAIGRWGGYPLLRRYGRRIHVDERRLKLGRYLFMLHGGKVVFFGRFVGVLRAWVAFLAGTSRMPWWHFFAFNAAGGIVWSAAVGLAAYFVGGAVQRLGGPVDIALGVAGAAIVVAGFVYVRREESRLAERAERALPGPLDEDAAGGQ